jgi:peptidoglycan/xylan/chitin deacetylase (PgdA/CDA1 family)
MKRLSCADIWPIDEKAGDTPEGFNGWPEKKRFALILTHDVDTEKGQTKCLNLSQIEESLGFRSSFNFVPERYPVDPDLRKQLVAAGFEVGVHGLNHDGKLYKNGKVFQERAVKINGYLKEWNAVGFRSPAMHRNLEWIHDLNIEYDCSTFDTDPFEPDNTGMKTIFPFWIPNNSSGKGYVELPYTLPQDFTLFILMKEKNIDIWKKKIDWIAKKGGMVLLNTHPDYMYFEGSRPGIEEYTVDYYQKLLEYIKLKYEGQYWQALPREVARFLRQMVKE